MKTDQVKWAILIILAFTWGSSFILIKKAIEYFDPIDVGALRICFAGFLFFPWAVKHARTIDRRLLKWIIIAGLCSNYIPIFLFPIAEVHLESSIAGILNSLVPLFVLLLGYFFFNSGYTLTQVLGGILGFIGAYVLLNYGNSFAQQLHLPSALLVILSTILYATGGLIVKNYLGSVPAFHLSTVIYSALSIPSFFLLFFRGFFSSYSGTAQEYTGLTYVAILGLVGTALAMILFYELIQRSSAVFATSVTYLMPIVAIGWGLLDGEYISTLHLIGGALILCGIYLINESSIKGKGSQRTDYQD